MSAWLHLSRSSMKLLSKLSVVALLNLSSSTLYLLKRLDILLLFQKRFLSAQGSVGRWSVEAKVFSFLTAGLWRPTWPVTALSLSSLNLECGSNVASWAGLSGSFSAHRSSSWAKRWGASALRPFWPFDTQKRRGCKGDLADFCGRRSRLP